MLKRAVLALFSILAIYIAAAYVYNNYLTQSLTFNRSPYEPKQSESLNYLKDKDTLKILIIDGGGIRGLIPLYVINYIENRLNKPISEVFDIYSGVSTGAIIASGINIPEKYIPADYAGHDSATEYLIQLYKEESDYLFSSPWYHDLLSGWGLFSPSFLGERLHRVLETHYTKSLTFTDLNNFVIIPALDIHSGRIHLFQNRGDAVRQLPTNSLYQLVAAAVSAETVFPPVAFRAAERSREHSYFADAAMAMNNPTSLVLLNILEKFPNKKYYVLILGAGSPPLVSAQMDYSELKNWGRIRWIQDAFSSIYRFMDRQQLLALDLAQLFSDRERLEYDYLNIEVTDPFVDIFDYKSLQYLEIHADRLIEENQQKMERIIERLNLPDEKNSKNDSQTKAPSH
ncbi:patatin-like phospholipase family protein [Microbulbifer variabilis]|uniref:patatin-like phospholipase family protein n=1 Tax=Microbulbifer variabilis TaxID=266805 RepID=UPI001CFC70B4|nr:patatin-like phospholipase family protein [Microbulbifer variabilis]